jgi:hypothetical protein
MTYSFNQFVREVKQLTIQEVSEREMANRVKLLLSRVIEENPEEGDREFTVISKGIKIKFKDLLEKDPYSEEWREFLFSLML